jgi:signal peptidase I
MPMTNDHERTMNDDERTMNEVPESSNVPQPHRESSPAVPSPVEPCDSADASGGASAGAWLRDLLISVAVSLFIIFFLYQPVRVEGISMMPGLVDQDRLFINKFEYHLGEIHRGDVVVFFYPRDQRVSYIKRVVGVPGDTVRIDRGQVYVNGEALKEPYVPVLYEDDHSMGELTVPAGQYFVLGDHRSVASDSRYFGTVPRALIYGKAAFVYWPMDQAGVVH